ncbi:MAG: hypothetical protein WC325_08405 [Candidatus Bathyarchaeia archaeon]
MTELRHDLKRQNMAIRLLAFNENQPDINFTDPLSFFDTCILQEVTLNNTVLEAKQHD